MLNQLAHLHGENAENAQEKAGDREVRTGGDVDDGGGTELIASQDEPHGEEPATLMPRRTGSCQPISTPPRKPDTYTYALQEGGPHTPHTHTSHAHTCRMPRPRSLATPISHLPQRSAVRRRRLWEMTGLHGSTI